MQQLNLSEYAPCAVTSKNRKTKFVLNENLDYETTQL